MKHSQLIMSFVLVALGAVLATSGPGAPVRIGLWFLANAELMLLVAAGLSLLLAIAPRGALTGPGVLVLAALTVSSVRQRWWEQASSVWTMVGVLIVLLGGVIGLASRPEVVDVDPIHRRRIIMVPWTRTIRLEADQKVPEVLSVIAVASRVVVDLRKAPEPKREIIEVAVSCWAANVQLLLPDSWAVVAGRLNAARRVRFSGSLDSPDPAPYPYRSKTAHRLVTLAGDRKRRIGKDEVSGPVAVVIHVLGFLGYVSVRD